MPEQETKINYEAIKPKDPTRDYAGKTGKLKDVGGLIDGVDKLVSKVNIADQYKQQGGQ